MSVPTPPVPGVPPIPGAAPAVPGSAPTQAPEQGINWGELMKTAGEQLQPVPKGSYDCYVDTATADQTSTGKLMYKVKLKIDGGPSNGRVLWTNITLTTDNPNALAMFFRNMDAFGLGMDYFASNPHPDAVAEALLGRRVRVVVDHRIWQNATRENVKQIMKPQGVAAVAGVPVPGATSVPASVPVVPSPASAPQPAAPPSAPVAPPAPVATPPAPEPVQEEAPAPQGIDLDAYRAAGWSDEQLIAAGHMPAPEPEPETPPVPEAPAPAGPPAPPAQSTAGGPPAPPPVPF